jgi:hypothetical protein
VDANLAPSRSRMQIDPSWKRSPGLDACPGSKSNTPASCWRSPPGTRSRQSPPDWSVTEPPSGASVAATSRTDSRASCWTTPTWGVRRRFPPLQRAQIVALACLEPVAKGLHITHWTSADLARQAVEDGIVDALGARTVRRILHDVDLQPHRTRYWKTARLDALFKDRAEKVLWCYGNAERLVHQGIWTVAVDEVPNFQVLERNPIRRAIPGAIEQQEFEYTRHGTVNLLLFLIVHTGRMEVVVEAKKDAATYIGELQAFHRRHRGLRGVYLIQDGDPSHTSGDTATYWSGCRGWWRPRFTPAHASWLNQAELLIGAFGYHYLKRESRVNREEFIGHVLDSGPEYNQRYAHPFEWMWTNQAMRKWFAEHAP